MATISRQVFGQSLLDAILPAVKQSCITLRLNVDCRDWGSFSFNYDVRPGQTPQTATVTPASAGSQIVDIAYTSQNDPETSASDSNMSCRVQMSLAPNYSCQVAVVGTTVSVVQRLWAPVSITLDVTNECFTPYDTSVTDVYDLSVGQGVSLQLVRDPTKEVVANNAQPAPMGMMNMWEGVRDLGKELGEQFGQPPALDLIAVVSGLPPNSIPEGVTFTSAAFDNQDLVLN